MRYSSNSFSFDADARTITLRTGEVFKLDDPKAFSFITHAWINGFTWLGRPVIQLPEDMLRIQEVIYETKPDVIVETGVAHGGSLIFYASLCTAIGKGRVIGIDIKIRTHNRAAIEEHRLSPLISLVEGSSIDADIVQSVKDQIGPAETVLVLLDSNHHKDHVLAELEAYSSLVSPGSYIVACDGVMQQVVGAPRTAKDWIWNNPLSAVNEFVANHHEFECVEPIWPFNESKITERVTYWPRAFLRKKGSRN